MKIIITEEQKKKLFIPRKLSGDDSRYSEWNKEQPIKDGVRINQYDPEGNKIGYWENYYKNGKIQTKGNYINGKREGIWEIYFDNGQLYCKCNFKNNYKDGIWEYYWENGQLSSKELYDNGEFIKSLPLTESKKLFIPRKLSGENSRWSDWNKEQPIIDGKRINQYDLEGRKEGYWEEYWDPEERSLSKGNYINGKREGIWDSYDLDGNIENRILYKNGKFVKDIPLTESKKLLNLKEGRVKASDRIKVYEDDKILVVVPLTHMASCKYGAKTPWCVAVPSNDEHFNEYSDNGILFYFIIKSPYEYGDIKEYKFAYYKSFNVNMEEFDGWYDMSDYRYDEENEKSTEVPDIKLLKFLIPKKVMELVNNFIKEQTPVYQKKILDRKKFILDKLMNDPDNHKIVDDKDWVIMYRDEPFGNDYDRLDWFPNPTKESELFVIYGNKNNYKTYRQEIPFYIDIRTYKHSKDRNPKVTELNSHEEVPDMMKVFLSYFKNIAISFFSNRKKYFNPPKRSYMYLHPNYVSVGDKIGYSDGSKIVSIEPIIGSYKPYKIDTDRSKDIYYNTDLGVGLEYDKEKHNPSKI